MSAEQLKPGAAYALRAGSGVLKGTFVGTNGGYHSFRDTRGRAHTHPAGQVVGTWTQFRATVDRARTVRDMFARYLESNDIDGEAATSRDGRVRLLLPPATAEQVLRSLTGAASIASSLLDAATLVDENRDRSAE